MTREDEEARLEAAMQRGDELLVNSLKRDDRRRIRARWIAAMSVITTVAVIIAFALREPRDDRQVVQSTPERPTTAPIATPSPNAFPEKLASLKDDDWRRAYAVGSELAKLPPDQSWPIVERNWSKIPNFEARQQILKSFVLTPPHPRTLDVMHLGMTDPEPQVRAWAVTYLNGIAYQDFAEDSAAYEKWRTATAGRPVADVAAEGAAAWVGKLKVAKGDQIKREARYIRVVRNDLSRFPTARDAALNAGALDVAVGWLREFSSDGDIVVGARDLLTALKPDEAYLKRVIIPMLDEKEPIDVRRAAVQTLGRADNKWAVDALLAVLRESVTSADKERKRMIWDVASSLSDIGDPRAIPDMIGAIDHDDTYDTVYGVGYFGLSKITGVRYDESHNGQWWKQWWDRERKRFPEPARSSNIPDLDKSRAARSDAEQTVRPIYAMAEKPPVPVEELRVKNDENMRYFLMGPKTKPAPAEGYRLLLVLPGGDGSAEFRGFIENVAQNALPKQYLVAELIAPKWYDGEDGIVWPTEKSREKKMKFTTEQFIDAVVADVAAMHRLDASRIYALGWSSSGPAVYYASMRPKTPITGAFVAMSVFKPAELPAATNAKGRPFYILHSPQDFIRMTFPENARKQLTAGGAKVKLQTYEGGHGWQGDPFAMIRAGVDWLESQPKTAATRAATPTTRVAK